MWALARFLAQETQPTSDVGTWEDLLRVYGALAPFALALLIAVVTLWKKVNATQGELSRAQEATIDKVVPALQESNRLLAEANRAFEKMSSSAVSPEDVRRLQSALDRVEDLLRYPPTPPRSRPRSS